MSFEVVITGASGFIGSALLTRLLEKKITVTGLSRQSKEGLTTVSSYLDYQSSGDAVLVHLAQPRDASNPSDNTEIELSRSLFEKPWKHIVYVSSSIVYGDAKEYARRPEEEVTAFNAYTDVKLACEKLAIQAGGTCLRFANIYGPGMAANSVVADILSQIPGDGKLYVRDETPVRDFLWIDDAIHCLTAVVHTMPGGILNVGSGVGVAIGTIAETALLLAGENYRQIVSKNRGERLSSLVLDISQTRTTLNWMPETDLNSGLSYLLKKKLKSENE